LTQYDRGKGWKAQTQHTDSRSHRRHFLHNRPVAVAAEPAAW
jgi:hypothetical protein